MGGEGVDVIDRIRFHGRGGPVLRRALGGADQVFDDVGHFGHLEGPIDDGDEPQEAACRRIAFTSRLVS